MTCRPTRSTLALRAVFEGSLESGRACFGLDPNTFSMAGPITVMGRIHMSKVIYLVDASTFIYRSYHAIRHLATSDGRPTNAVYGFLTTLNKLLREKQPTFLAVVYDAKGPSFRQKMYEAYKANRPPMPDDLIAQQEPIRRVVKALGLPSVEVAGLEADDIVATLAQRSADQGFEVVIVSSDKDYYQLLSDKISMYDPNPKKESALSARTMQDKFGVRPDQFLDVQGLMGDSTDNIPGVPGVGEKTALKLIDQFGTLENLFEHLDEIPQAKLKEKLAENKESAFLSRDLARLKTDAEVGVDPKDLVPAPPDTETLAAFYKDMEFKSLAAELGPSRTISYDDYHLVTTAEDLESLVEELAKVGKLSVDLETTSIDPMRAAVVGLSLSGRPHRSFYLPVGHQALGSSSQLPWDVVREKLRPLLEGRAISKVGQNIKYDYIVLKRHGVDLGPIGDDSMIASYLLDPGTGGHNLERLSRTHLGHDPITYEEVVGSKKQGFQEITPEAARDYACEDADLALLLSETLREQLVRADLLGLYEDMELPLIEVLADMEMNGVLLDVDLLRDLSKELQIKMARTEEKIYTLAGREFKINSPKQLGQVLFEELNLPQGKKNQEKKPDIPRTWTF